MITNRRVFEDNHLPNQLLHREAGQDQLARAFGPAVSGGCAKDVLLHGPSGVGKTVLARHTLGRLEERADIDRAFVESLGLSTAGILRAILAELPGETLPTNTPLIDLDVRLRERVDGPVIVVLDEADGIPDVGALDRLVDVDGLSMVAICHDADDWLARCEDSVRNRFAGRSLRLDRYHVDELTDILRERGRLGLEQGIVERRQLETIADEVAGVARFGIQSLLAAAEIALERDHRSIKDADVHDAFTRARRWIRASNLKSLPFHHQLLYELVRQAGTIDAPTLHERYDNVADEVYHGRDLTPLSERARRNKLTKLREYDLIDWNGESYHRRYRVLDKSIEIATNPVHAAK